MEDIIVDIFMVVALVFALNIVKMEGYKILIVLVTVVVQFVRMEGYYNLLIALVTVAILYVNMSE